MDLADKIKELREKRGMKQTDLALSIGVSGSTVSGWERKIHNPSRSMVSELERVFREPLTGYRRAVTPTPIKKPSKGEKTVYGANKRVDVGKIGALYRARWKVEEIARDVRISEEEVMECLRRMKDIDGQRKGYHKNN